MKNERPIILVGAGENGHVVEHTLRQSRQISGFLDDKVHGNRVLSNVHAFRRYLKTHDFFVTFGNNEARRRTFLLMKSAGAHFTNAIHPTAVCEPDVQLGENIFIGALCYINIRTRIGDNTLINNGCIVEHDNRIGAHTHLTPGVITGGQVRIGSKTFIGLGARINDHLQIGNNVIVGSGSVIIKSVPSGVTVVGIPGRIVSQRKAPTGSDESYLDSAR